MKEPVNNNIDLLLSKKSNVSDSPVYDLPETSLNENNAGNKNSQQQHSTQPTVQPISKKQQRVSAAVINESNIVIKTVANSNSGADKKSLIHKQPRVLSLSQQAQQRYQSAYEFLLANQQQKAQEELRNALMFNPGHNKSRELLAGIYIKNGRINEARTLLQYGIRISPSHFIFAKLYARILMEQHDNITAISVLQRNPPTHETDSGYFALLAALYQKTKQHHKAAKLYGQLLTLRDSYGVWWLGLAISLEALGNEAQAKLAYEKAKNSGNLNKGLYQYTDQRVTALAEIEFP